MSLKKYIVPQRGKRMYLISHNSTIVKQHLIRIEMEEILTQKKKTIRRRRKKKADRKLTYLFLGFFSKIYQIYTNLKYVKLRYCMT